MSDWWEHYAEGKMIRRDDTPLSIIRTLEDWCNAALTGAGAMGMFVDGKPVSPSKLQTEIIECIHSNNIDNERQKLRNLEVWAIRESALAEAAKSLRDARKRFAETVQHAGLDPYYADKIATALPRADGKP